MNIDWGRLLPQFWFQSEPTHMGCDGILNALLDEYGVSAADEYTAKIGPIEVWIANYPYSYGKSYVPEAYVLPTTKTRRRLRKMVNEANDPLAEIKSIIEKNK